MNKEKSEVYRTLRTFITGEQKKENPLKNLPTPQIKLYGFNGIFHSAFFKTKKEFKKFLISTNTNIPYSDICTIEYLGNVAGRNDVIRKTTKREKALLYSICDTDGYVIYNEQKSINEGKFIWEYNYGSLEEIYEAFKKNGITIQNDVYEKEKELFAFLNNSALQKKLIYKKVN